MRVPSPDPGCFFGLKLKPTGSREVLINVSESGLPIDLPINFASIKNRKFIFSYVSENCACFVAEIFFLQKHEN